MKQLTWTLCLLLCVTTRIAVEAVTATTTATISTTAIQSIDVPPLIDHDGSDSDSFVVVPPFEEVSSWTTARTAAVTEFPFVMDDVSLEWGTDANVNVNMNANANMNGNGNGTKQEQLMSLRIQVRNGTLAEMDAYPGLWIRQDNDDDARNKFAVTTVVVGLLEDLQAFVKDGNIAYLPPRRDWEGPASVQFTMEEYDVDERDGNGGTSSDNENENDNDNDAYEIIRRFQVQPFIEFNVQLHPPRVRMNEDETLSFQAHNITLMMEGCGGGTGNGNGNGGGAGGGAGVLSESESGKVQVDDVLCELRVQHGSVSKSIFQGTITSVMKEISSSSVVRYDPHPDFHGVDEIEMQCSCALEHELELELELGPEGHRSTRSSSTSITVDIYPVNDEPQIMLRNEDFSVLEDEIIKLGVATGLYIIDADVQSIPPSPDSKVIIDLEITTGQTQGQGQGQGQGHRHGQGQGQLHLPDVSQLGGIRTMKRMHDKDEGTRSTTTRTSSYLRIMGRIDRINIALRDVWISFPQDWHGSGKLHVKCTDSIRFDETISDWTTFGDGDEWVEASVDYVVHPINDAPLVTACRDAFVGLNGGGIVPLGPDKIEIHDVDAGLNETLSLKLSLIDVGGVSPGNFQLNVNHRWGDDMTIIDLAAGGTIYSLDESFTTGMISSPTIELKGTIHSLTAALEKIEIRLTPNWHGIIHDGLTVEIVDAAGARAHEVISMSLLAPTNRLAKFVASTTNITSKEDQTFELSQMLNLTVALSSRDYSIREQSAWFKVRLRSAFGGKLHFNTFIQGCFVEDGLRYNEQRHELTLYGTIEVVNSALESLAYTPARNLDSFDEVIFEIYDERRKGKSDEMLVRIDLEAVNDKPEIHLPTVNVAQNFDGTHSVHLAQLQITDDGPTSQILGVEFYLPPDVGRLQLNGKMPETLQTNGKSVEGELSLKGMKADLNAAVENMAIQITGQYVGESSLTVRVSDSENLSSTKVVSFKIDDSYSLPRIKPRNTTLFGVEDQYLHLDNAFSWAGGNSSDSKRLEMTLMTKRIQISRVSKIDFTPSTASTCEGNRMNGNFALLYGSQKTDLIKITDSESAIEASLLQLTNVSAAKIHKTQNTSGTISFEIRLLTFVDKTLDEESKIRVTDFEVSNGPASMCLVDFSISSAVDVQSYRDFKSVWNMADVKNFNFRVSESAELGGVHFLGHDYREHSSESIVMRGTLTSLEKALKEVRLEPPSNFFGKAVMVIRINGVNNSAEHYEQDFPMTFKSVDDRPEIWWEGSVISRTSEVFFNLEENADIELVDLISVHDDDCGEEEISLTLEVESGQLCCRNETLLLNHLQASGEASQVIDKTGQQLHCSPKGGIVTFTKKIYETNQLVQRFVYKPRPYWWGMDKMIANLKSQEEEVSASINLFVEPVENRPGLKLPETMLSPIHIMEDSFYELKGIQVFDHDIDPGIPASVERCIVNRARCYLSVDLNVNHGTLEVETAIPPLIGAQNKISFRGTVDELNADLQNITYRPHKDYVGNDELTISVSDNLDSSYTDIVNLFIDPVHDAPLIFLPKVLHMVEDIESLIGGADEYCSDGDVKPPFLSCQPIQIHDADLVSTTDNYQNSTMRVKLKSTYLQVKLPRLRSINAAAVFSNNAPRDTFHKDIEIYGPIEDINWILHSIVLKGDLHYNTRRRSPAILDIQVEDADGASTTKSMELLVHALNDKPVISVELPLMIGLEVEEDTTIQVQGITVQDVDCNGGDFLELRLSATFGAIYVFGKSDSFLQSLVFRSSIDEINELLASYLLYRPPLNFFGIDSLEVTISDLGNHGSTIHEEVLFDNASISLNVRPISDIPIVHAPEFMRIKEDSTTIFDVSIEHFDSHRTELAISMDCTQGHLQMYTSENLSLSLNDGTAIIGIGSVEAWNLALSRLLYTPDRNSNSAGGEPLEQITIKARNSIDEVTQTETKIIYIYIDDSPDPPQWIVPESSNELHVLEDDSVSLNIQLRDDDHVHAETIEKCTYFVRISAFSGLIQLNSYQGIFFRDGVPTSSTSLLEFDSTLTSINRALERLVYAPMPNFNGQDEISLFVFDSESSYNSTARIPITVIPTYDTPQVVSPVITECEEEEICTISSGLFIEDPDKNSKLQIGISSEVGKVSFIGDFDPALIAVDILHGAVTGANNIIMTGSASNLNRMLARLAYLPHSGIHVDLLQFSIHVIDAIEPHSESTSEMQIVLSQNIAKNRRYLIRYDRVVYHDGDNCPSSYHETNSTGYGLCNKLTQVDQTIHCLEDLECPIIGFTIRGDSSSSVRVKIQVEHGTVDLGSFVEGIDDSMSTTRPSRELEFLGLVKIVNEALSHLVYYPAQNYAGDDKFQMHLYGGADYEFQHSHEINISVKSTFDSLTLNGPAHHLHFVAEDKYLSIKGIELSHVSKDELLFVQVVIQATHGKIHFTNGVDSKKITVMTSLGSALWWQHASICGTFDDMKALLTEITFIADKNWNSVENQGEYAEVTIEVERKPDCVSRSIDDVEDSISIPIIVNPVNDPPQIHVEDNFDDDSKIPIGDENTGKVFHIDEDHDLMIPVSISDVDDEIVKVILRTNGQGKISVVDSKRGYFSDTFFIEGDGSGHFHEKIAVKGQIAAINRYLQNLKFKGKGKKSIISLKAIDNSGGSHSIDLPIHIRSIEDDIILWMVVDESMTQPTLTFNEGESKLIGGDWLRDDMFMETRNNDNGAHKSGVVRSLSDQRVFSFSLPDTSMLSSFYICAEVSVDLGFISIESQDGLTFESEKSGSHIRFGGTLNDINRAGNHIMFHAQGETTGRGALMIKASKEVCEDAGSYSTHRMGNSRALCRCDFDMSPEVNGKVDIFISHHNFAPEVTWIGSNDFKISVEIDAIIGIEDVRIIDDDFALTRTVDVHDRTFEGLLTVTIEASRGVVWLSSPDRVSFIDGNAGMHSSKKMHFACSLRDANDAIASLKYQCSSTAHGCNSETRETIRIFVDDNGFSGEGGSLQNELMLEVEIVPTR